MKKLANWIVNSFSRKTINRLEFIFRILPFVILIGGVQIVNPGNQIVILPILFFSLFSLFIWTPLDIACKIIKQKDLESKENSVE